jgi:hypothetical protein
MKQEYLETWQRQHKALAYDCAQIKTTNSKEYLNLIVVIVRVISFSNGIKKYS